MYNFGFFDFDQENFLLNFVRGLMTYRIVARDPGQDIAYSIQDKRRVSVQLLNLTQQQKQRLINHLESHRQPENASYRYDYFQQNCSTKVRDALNFALGGNLRTAIPEFAGEHSYRSSFGQYSSAIPWMHIGTNLALGTPVDAEIPTWSPLYLPDQLEHHLAKLSAFDGSSAPLVLAARVINEGEPTGNPWHVALPIAAIVSLLALLLVYQYRWASLLWAFASGLLGCVLIFLWTATDHWATATNPTIALLSPALLIWALSPDRIKGWLVWVIGIGMVVGLALSHSMVQQSFAVLQILLLFSAVRSLGKTSS